MISRSAILGILIGLLITGVIGVYIGDKLLTSAALNETALYASQQPVSNFTWTWGCFNPTPFIILFPPIQ